MRVKFRGFKKNNTQKSCPEMSGHGLVYKSIFSIYYLFISYRAGMGISVYEASSCLA